MSFKKVIKEVQYLKKKKSAARPKFVTKFEGKVIFTSWTLKLKGEGACPLCNNPTKTCNNPQNILKLNYY